MTYGIYCKVCDRLLWKLEKPLANGEIMLSKLATHAVTSKPATNADIIQWCGCKGRLGQQELVSP